MGGSGSASCWPLSAVFPNIEDSETLKTTCFSRERRTYFIHYFSAPWALGDIGMAVGFGILSAFLPSSLLLLAQEFFTTPLLSSSAVPDDEPSHLIFASITSLLLHWPNTLFPNGHSLVLGSVVAGTVLYHARKDDDPPPRLEWLAFDAEYSYEVMATWGNDSFLNTYISTRPLRVLYIDGSSSVLGGTGPLDSQGALVWGNVTLEQQNQPYQEFERAERLCNLGTELGFEGVVRMNAGFELLWCDFDRGLRFINRINITDPLSKPDRSSSISSYDGRQYSFERCELAPDLCRGNFPEPLQGPFALLGGWERQRAAIWHYHAPGESRIKLDLATMVSFYDPEVKSLAEIRKKEGTENRRDKQRILGISDEDVQYVTKQFRDIAMQKKAANWRPLGSGIDWEELTRSVVQRYGSRLAELRWILRPETDQNHTAVALEVQSVVYPALMPYIDMTSYSTENIRWLEPAQERCALVFSLASASETPLTRGEQFIQSSVESVLRRICLTLMDIFGHTQLLNLNLDNAHNSDADDYQALYLSIERWRSQIHDLMEWLGWAMWIRCDGQCAWDEVCKIPMWPVSGGAMDGRHEEDVRKPIVPACVRRANPETGT